MASVEKDFVVKKGLVVASGEISTTSTSAAVFDTIATTINAFRSGTNITIGATTGSTTIRNSLSVPNGVVGNLTGNADTASTLQTARNISLGGDLSGSASFNGSSNITITATIQPNAVELGTDTTGNYVETVAKGVGDGLTVTDAPGEGTNAVISIASATAATPNTLVYRDATGSAEFEDLVVNGDLNVTGNQTITGTTEYTGDVVVTGDLAVNGGDITTTAATFNVATANATTINIGGAAATTVFAGDIDVADGTFENLTVTGNSNLGNGPTDETNVTGLLTASENVSFAKDLTVGGDLIVNGTTTSVNSTVTTLNDPVITLANDTSVDDNKDRGIEYKWNDGSTKTGFFGYDDSTGYFTFIPDATNSSEVFSGAVGDIQAANFRGNLIGGTVDATTGTFTGDIAVNGGDISTTSTTASVFDTTATTVNAFRAGTAITMGATTGTFTVRNPTVVGSQATQNLYNTVATTMNFAGAATNLTVGSTSGTATLRNPTVVGSQATQNLYNTVATTMNFAGASTNLTIGATSGTATIRNASTVLSGDLTVNGGDITLGGTGRIQGIDTVTDPTDAASKDYVDTAVAGAAVESLETTTDTSIAAAATPTEIYSFAAASYRAAKIIVQASHATQGHQVYEALLVHNGTDVHMTEYADIFTGAASLVEITADITTGNVVVTGTAANTNTSVKVLAIARIPA